MTDNTTKGRIYTMTSPPPNEDAAAEQQDSVPATGKNPLEQGKNESAGVIEKKWDDLKKGLGTIKEAIGLGVSPEMASAARDRVKEVAKDMAKDAIFRVGGGGGPEERAAKAREQVDAQIDQMRQAYSRNGLAGMVGAMATNMAMEKVAGKVIGAAKTGVGKTGDAPHDSKSPTVSNQKDAPPQRTDGVHVDAREFRRNMSERRKALLRDADDPNSDLTPEARKYIKDNNGEKVPNNYEVSHETPLYTEKSFEGKKALDVSDNMKTMPKQEHRLRHMTCGDQFHDFPKK